MGLDSSLITSFLDDCNIQYDVDDDNWVSFSYEENIFVGYVDSAGIIASCLDLGLPRIWEVPPIEKKRFLKIINQLNEDVPIVKYTLNEEDNYIYIDAQTSLDPNPDIDDLIPELMKLLMAAKGYFVDKMNK